MLGYRVIYGINVLFGSLNESAALPPIDQPVLRDPSALAALARGGDKAPSLALRLDEAALTMHPIGPIRLILVLCGGLIGAMILSWPATVAWVVGGWAIEGWSWFATRTAARGGPVSPRARLSFAANYLVMNVWWLVLGGLFWRAGGVAGHASAVAVLLALSAVLVLLFHNVPAGFLAAGAAPAIGALSVVMLADGHGWIDLLPVWMAVLMGGVFCLGRALEAPSIQQSNRRLNLSLSKFEVLAENVPDLIAQFDLEGRYLYVSPASLTVLGYPPEALVGTLVSELLMSGDLDRVRAFYCKMMADPDQTVVVTHLSRHKDGRWLSLQSNIKLILEDGVPSGAICVSRDTTDRVAADAALRAAKTEAEAANRVKSEFLANISHEFRTPMNGVLGALHLLESEPISREGRDLLANAKACGHALSQLLSDVLDVSRLAAGQLELSPEPLDLAALVRAVAGLLYAEAAAKGIELRCEITGADPWIKADPVHLRQALFNLVSNAVKFTAEGQVTVRLHVEAIGDKGRHVRLDVEDTGIGIPPAARSLLFEHFRQSDSSATRRFGGAGLGLPMTRALILMMGGDIGFRSTEGEGSTFWLTLNAAAAEPVAAAPVDEGMLEGVSILLVEDNPSNRLVARTMLTRLGAAVEDAEDGLKGLEAARRGAHDLILMDIQMPVMGGVEAARSIRGLPGTAAQVPIIALTANVMAHQKAEYLAAGMNGVVAKPISPMELMSEIARLAEDGDGQRGTEAAA